MFKINITKRKLLTLQQVKDLPAGTLLRVIDKNPEESDCTGEIVIKTNNEEYPFVTVIGTPPYTDNTKDGAEDCYVLWEVYDGFDFELIGLGHECIKLENEN